MKMIAVLSIVLAAVGVQAVNVQLGTENTHFSQVGPHFPVLIVKKSINPENVLAVYTKLNANCEVVIDSRQSNKPTLNFYWLMDGQTYKPMNSMLERGVRRRLAVQEDVGSTKTFTVIASDLNEVRHDLPSASVRIKSEKTEKGCFVAAMMTLGPAHGGETIRVESFYADADFGGNVDKVIVEGTNSKGQKVIAEYQGR